MKRFILCSMLLLIGMIFTASASPPGLNSKSNVIVQVLPDKADLQAAIANYNFVAVPDVARSGCIIGVVNYTLSADYCLQAELQPIFLFKHTELTYGDNSNTELYRATQELSLTLSLFSYIEPVCAIARNGVLTVISSSIYQNGQFEVLLT